MNVFVTLKRTVVAKRGTWRWRNDMIELQS